MYVHIIHIYGLHFHFLAENSEKPLQKIILMRLLTAGGL